MLPLSCTCSPAREDVSYPKFGGTMAPVVTQRRPNVASKVLAAGHLNWSLLLSVWRIPFQPHTLRALAAYISMSSRSLYPHMGRILATLVMFGASRHGTTCRTRAPRAQRRLVVSSLNCSLLPWRPIPLGQLEPTTLPLRRLAPVSCSVGLSPTLSLSLSLLPPLSLSLPFSPFLSHCVPLSLSLLSVPLPLCPTLSPSRIKGGFGTFGGSLSPPGFEPSSTGQKRCGISTGPR